MKKLFLLLLWSISATAQELPHNTVGRLAGQMIAALNSRDEAKQLAFIQANFSKDALKGGTAFQLKGFTYLNSNVKALSLAVAQTFPDTHRLDLVLRSNDQRWLSLQLRLNGQKLDGYGLGLAEDPAVTKAYAWPKTMTGMGEIDRQVTHAAATGAFSGVVLVAKNGKVLFDKAYGLADQTFKVPNDTATLFNIGSMNKMFTSVAIGQLVQAGKLSFTDTLSKFLPDFPNAGQITIAQLLSHTSGLGDFFKDEFYAHKKKYVDLAGYLPLFAGDKLAFTPGSRWSYSNAGYIVLGLVIEKLSGQDYFTYVRQHIYAVAGMSHTDSYNMETVIPNLATGYMRPEGFDPLHLVPRQMNWAYLPLKGSSAGGYTTAGDLFRFSLALQNHRLLNKELTEMLLNGKVPTGGRGPNVQYGYGFFDTLIGNQYIAGHGGGAEGLNADLKMFRDGSYTIIVLSNYDAPAAAGLSQQIATYLLQP